MKNTLFVILSVCLTVVVGKSQVVSWEDEGDGLLLHLQNGTMKIFPCTDKIVRMTYSPADTIPAKASLVVIKEWENAAYEILDGAVTIKLNTPSLTIVVDKSEAKIGYYTTDGVLLLIEDSRLMVPRIISEVNTNTSTAVFNSPANEAIYGLGQHQESIMNYKGRSQTLDQANMQIAVPVILSNMGYGILWDNYSRTVFDASVASSTKYTFESECGEIIDYYFIYGPEPDTIISAYRNATGIAPMFPKWAYGLFQSMDRYDKSEDFYGVANQYRKNKIPVDAIVQDFYYWDPFPWGSHKMNTTKYPDPKKLVDSLHALNFHTMISIWPIFSEGDENYNEMSGLNALYPSSGTRHYYDPQNTQARDIYWRQVNENLFSKYGWDAWWADGDEPDNWPDSYNRREAITALGPGFLYYNTYPLMHTSAVYKGWREDITDKRLFTLSRCSFAGQQRNAAASWSGDIQSNWTDFKKQLPAGLNFSLSGIPYWTTDIGGYWGADWTLQDNRELFTRWFQYGVFCPVFRIHGKLERTLYSETAWDAVTRNTLLSYDRLRYRLMPYIYSLAARVTFENYTIMRHLIMDFSNDPNVVNIANQFMFGPSIMVNPVAEKGLTGRQVYLPEGKWYDFWIGKSVDGYQTITANSPLDKIPLYIKAGSILPMGPDIEYATQSADPLEIRVYTGSDGSFTLYEDEGDNYNYERGQYSLIPFSYSETTHVLTIGNRLGSYAGMPVQRMLKIICVGEYYGTGIDIPVAFDTIITYSGSGLNVLLNSGKYHSQSHYEAEEAILTGNAGMFSEFTGFSGTGYVKGPEGSLNPEVEFHVNMEDSGNYLVRLRYAAATSDNQPLAFYVNDMHITDLVCPGTVSSSNWNTISYLVYLNAGENTLRFAINSMIHLDCIDFTKPSEPSPLQSAQKKIVRMRLQNSSLYLERSGNELTLNTKEESSEGQIWIMEHIDNHTFKISSLSGNYSLSVENGQTNNGSPVIVSEYSENPYQQWMIDDYGYGLCRITAKHSGRCFGAGDGYTLIQDSDKNMPFQRWILENPFTPGNGNGLTGEYYKGTTFKTLYLRRTDDHINFNWGSGKPDPVMPENSFAIRWTGRILPQISDEYTFYTRSDDGVRLWVNDSLIIDDWTARALTERSGKINLVAGIEYNIRLEYFDNAYDAIVSLEWECPALERQIIPKSQLFSGIPVIIPEPGDGNGLSGEYFAGPDFSVLKSIHNDEIIDFNWGNGKCDAALPADSFSVRWTGKLKPQFSHRYTFYSTSDDGFRVWINNVAVINNMSNPADKTVSGSLDLEADKLYDLKAEYIEITDSASVILEWESPDIVCQVIPRSQLFSDHISGAGAVIENKKGIKIFPNPASDFVNIEYSDPFQAVEIDIFNIMGMIIKSVNSFSGRLQLDTRDWYEGVYVVKLSTDSNSESGLLFIDN